MGNLASLDLKPSYHKGVDDIAQEFYLPCMSNAIKFDRAVGFFSSAIYVIAWPSLKEFVDRGGKIRMICSPLLSTDDLNAISEGYTARGKEHAVEMLREEIQQLLLDPHLARPTRVVAALVALDILDIKIAFLHDPDEGRHRRLFHDKVGIFTDENQNRVVFKGSMNETWSGLSAAGNLESIDVFVSWTSDRDTVRVHNETAYFDRLWTNRYPDLEVEEFPEVARQELVKAADTLRWRETVDEICAEMDEAARLSADRKPGGRRPRPHQIEALKAWFDRGRRGIFEHATGSGKTFTALCAIRDALGRSEIPVILVPSQLLLEQWYEELRTTLEDLSPRILRCGAGHTRWKQGLLYRWSRPAQDSHIILSTMQTASSQDFLENLDQGEHLFLVADEVHRLGSIGSRQILQIKTGPRLGLSATPRRAGDPEGTEALFTYFADIVPPPFTLADAIAAGTLTPYMYFVHSLELSETEQREWNVQTARIKQLYAQYKADPGRYADLLDRIKVMLINRARIIKAASGKPRLAADIIARHYDRDKRHRWIVYCDSLEQLHEVLLLLRAQGIAAEEYHSQMVGHRHQTLRYFELNSGVVISIRCLDEGVDIPSVTHALILASSKNPREFIQRRGRVLRRDTGKTLSYIHDVLVLPNPDILEEDPSISGVAILQGELARAIQFGRAAMNPAAVTNLQRIADRFGIDISAIVDEGFEDEND